MITVFVAFETTRLCLVLPVVRSCALWDALEQSRIHVPRTLQILRYSFGISSEVSSREGGFLQIVISWPLSFGTHAEPISPGSRGDIS